MPAIRVHHTATVDEPWDGPAEEAQLTTPVTKARGTGMYAWYDPAGEDPDGDGYPDAKADWKFPHHEVDNAGEPGAANMSGCRNGMSRLPQSDVPEADRSAVEAHLQAHMDDGMPDGMGAADLAADIALVTPKAYGHVTKAIFERAWAVQPQMLSFMAEFVRFRAAGGLLGADEIAERLAAAKAQNGDRAGGAKVGPVAVIPMYGLISQRQSLMSATSGGTSIDELRQTLRAALDDRSISAIVFDIDSPGGSVDGVPEFAAELRAARAGSKPIVAQVNTLAASAAYWLAAQMSEIVCTPSGEVGSIGVFAMHEDVSAAAEMAGVKTTLISAGPFKTEGNSYEPLSDTARGAIQGQVDDFYSMFLADVARGRKVAIGQVAGDYGQGRTLLAKKALAAGMVDRVDTLEATLRRFQPAALSGTKGKAALEVLPRTAIAASGTTNLQPDRAWNQRMKGLQRK